MREIHETVLVASPVAERLSDDVVRHGTATPDRVLLSRHVDGAWTDVTAAEFLADVRAVAKGLVASGVEAGDRVGLMSRTRFEWTLVDYAVWFAGGVTVPIYETSSAEQVEWILSRLGRGRGRARDREARGDRGGGRSLAALRPARRRPSTAVTSTCCARPARP